MTTRDPGPLTSRTARSIPQARVQVNTTRHLPCVTEQRMARPRDYSRAQIPRDKT